MLCLVVFINVDFCVKIYIRVGFWFSDFGCGRVFLDDIDIYIFGKSFFKF